MSEPIAVLRRHLEAAGPGAVADLSGTRELLARAWPDLDGSQDTSMASWKVARLETATWTPPVLAFTIERHGGTVMGSSRAEIQHWATDLDRRTAEVTGSTHRQLAPMASRLKIEPLVSEIMALIEAGADDPRVKWSRDRSGVTAVLSRVIPEGSGYKQTVQGRRRRFRDAWTAVMGERGWEANGTGFWVRRTDA